MERFLVISTVMLLPGLQIYVLHRLIRAWLTFRTDFYSLPVLLDPVVGTAIIALLSAAVVALCALPVFTKPFDRIARRRWLPSPSAKKRC